MVALNDSVKMVMLQFSFSNPDVAPWSVKCLKRETTEERNGRKSHSSGSIVIEPIENCSLVDCLEDIETAGYEMVEAFYQERLDGKDPCGKRTFHMVRFVFARHEIVELSEDFKKVRATVRAELYEMCYIATWRVRAFLNPFYKNNEEIAGQYTISINLEARKPLFLPNGQPVVVWQKDEKGNRIGDAPLPLKPSYRLHIGIKCEA